MQKLKETGDSRCIYQNEPVKDLTRRIASDKILSDKAFNIAKNPKFNRCQRGLASMIYTLLVIGMQVVPWCLQKICC